ncbi:hypothetical protein E2F46_11365 [Luteimonas aestuarii]|uniref:Glycosyltransferase RgtA/B/C/D-like domain-containing protein n=1 Tax=Luteimonas aestuarii TaxID=453837 RepID=A0A4V3ALJ2_9GAMM|nr:hypothetical protein [Luteimonas aestuarii]TDK23211.1 hypothetical protein E2F46_11365 [Luteimonas aestuarii]
MPVPEAGRRWRGVEAVSAVLLCVLCIAIGLRLGLQGADDDQYFLHALDDRGLFEFLASRYREWTGRILLEGALAATIGVAAVWKTLIPATFLGTAWCIWRLTLSRQLPMASGTLVVAVMLLLIHRQVLYEAAFWVTGFYNYLLPVFMGLLSITLLCSATRRRPIAVAVAACVAIIACQAEQVAFALLAVMSVRTLLRRMRHESLEGELVVLFAGGASAAASLLAPGNALRHVAELRWFPEHVDLEWSAKWLLGLDRLNVHAQSPANLLLVLLAALAAWLTPRMCRTATARVAAGILVLYVASAVVSVLLRLPGLEGWPRLGGVAAPLEPAEWMAGGIFVSMGFTIAVLGALVASAACRAKDLDSLIVGAGLPALAVASTMLVALSPTIHASGFRILFVGDLLLVLHAAMLVSTTLELRRMRAARHCPMHVPDAVHSDRSATPN